MEAIMMELLPILATVFLTICYLPQIIKIQKTKKVDSQSTWFWILLCVALGLMFTNAYMIYEAFGTYGYLVTETINLGLALTVLGQVIYYKNKNKVE